MLNQVLAKIFDFFKTKSPKVYALFIAVVGVVWALDGMGILDLPQVVIDTLLALGLVSGTHTSNIKQ
jgi:hypothetical protein